MSNGYVQREDSKSLQLDEPMTKCSGITGGNAEACDVLNTSPPSEHRHRSHKN